MFPSRTNSFTRQYAEAAHEVATSSKIPVADLWTAFMTAAGWKEGEPLTGSKDLPRNDKLGSLFTDGLLSLYSLARPYSRSSKPDISWGISRC